MHHSSQLKTTVDCQLFQLISMLLDSYSGYEKFDMWTSVTNWVNPLPTVQLIASQQLLYTFFLPCAYTF